MSDLFYWLLALIVLVIGIYLDTINIRQALRAKKAKEVFLKNHPASQMEVLSSTRTWIFGVLAFLCIGALFIYLFSVFSSTSSETASQIVLYIGLFAFCLAMCVESYTTSHLAVGQDGFMVLDEYIRYKNIQSIEIGKGIFSNSTLALMNGTTMSLSKPVLRAIEPLLAKYRQERKNRKGKKRKAHA